MFDSLSPRQRTMLIAFILGVLTVILVTGAIR